MNPQDTRAAQIFLSRHDRVAIRHFSGVMDEFLLFNCALNKAEITELAD